MYKKSVYLLLITFFISSFLFTQQINSQVDFYGSISNVEDTDTLDLTEDLYFTQLVSLNRFKVNDLRDRLFTHSIFDDTFTSQYVFYMDISQQESKWTCILHLINKDEKKDITFSSEYLGYYKILMEAKNSLTALLSKFDVDASLNNSDSEIVEVENTVKQTITLEKIAGTWTGDSSIDKIILMKAGRGFIIYKNGASMSVTISINKNIVTIEQVAKSNASFYPDLPREIALLSAPEGNKIYWVFSIIEDKKMEGIKHTLVPVYENKKIVSAKTGTVEVSWIR